MSNIVSNGMKAIAAFAFVFGIVSIVKGGSVVFGPQSARDAVGAFVPFVVKFNMVAGVFYALAAIGIWQGKAYASKIAKWLVISTGVVATAFVVHVILGGAYSMQTVGALPLRIGFWTFVCFMLRCAAR